MMIKPDIDTDPIGYAREIVGKDPLAVFLGVSIDEVKDKYARCSLLVKKDYLNAVDRAHGGIIHALADQAFAVACNSFGSMAVALSFNINYVSAARPGDVITAEAFPVNIANKVSVWDINVKDSKGSLVAAGRGVAYHKPPKK
jgi:acyl-CoA thioesterase